MENKVIYKVFVFDEDGLPQFIAATGEEAACEEYANLFSDSTSCRELDDAALDRIKVAVTDDNDLPAGQTITMREHLAVMTVGETDAAFFLCGEE